MPSNTFWGRVPDKHHLDVRTPYPSHRHRTQLTAGSGEAPVVAQRPGQGHGRREGLVGAIGVDLRDGRHIALAERAAHACLAELEAGPQLERSIAHRSGAAPDRAGDIRGRLAVTGVAQGGRPAKLQLQAEGGVGQRVGQGRDLGERLEAVAGAVEHAERVVAQEQERHPVARLRDDGEAELDRAQDLLRGVPAECLAGGLDREPRARLGVAGRTGVVGEHRQALRSRLAVAAQQLDDDRMDLPASARRQRVDDELANLLVREPVVRGRPFGISDQEPCDDRGRNELGEVDVLVGLPVQPLSDRRAGPGG